MARVFRAPRASSGDANVEGRAKGKLGPGHTEREAGEAREPSARLIFHLPPLAPNYLAAGEGQHRLRAGARARLWSAPGGARPPCGSSRLLSPGRRPPYGTLERATFLLVRAPASGVWRLPVSGALGSRTRRSLRLQNLARLPGPGWGAPGPRALAPALGYFVTAGRGVGGRELCAEVRSQADWTARWRDPGPLGACALSSPQSPSLQFSPLPPPTFILIRDGSGPTAFAEPTYGGEIQKFPATNSLHFFVP